MLVSSIAKFNSIVNQYNSALNIMQSRDALLSLSHFGSENANLALLHEHDKALSSNILQNALLYKISEVQGEEAKKREDADIKRSFSTFA